MIITQEQLSFEFIVYDLSKLYDVLVMAFLHDRNFSTDTPLGCGEHSTRGISKGVWQSLVVFLNTIYSLDSL